MQKIISSKKGASLLEVIATVTITSIALLMIYNILSYNIRQNGVNQEKMVNSNVANGALSYIISKDFKTIDNHLGDGNYAIIDENSCNSLFSDDLETCRAVLSPVINNKTYNADNLYVYVIPFNDRFKLEELITTPPPQAPEILVNYLSKIDLNSLEKININENAVTIIVIVESSINERYDYLLKGVITNVE